MMAMQLSNLIMGLIIANWLDYGMSFYAGSVQWRFPCAFQIVFVIIVCTFMPFLPESPRYLARKGRFQQSIKVLAALRGQLMTHPEIKEEMSEIRYAIEVEHEEEGSWTDV